MSLARWHRRPGRRHRTFPGRNHGMHIAYVTTDEVNSDLARRWGRTCACQITVRSPRDPLPNGAYDAAIYDLDYLLSPLHEEVLTKLLSTSQPHTVAVHGY